MSRSERVWQVARGGLLTAWVLSNVFLIRGPVVPSALAANCNATTLYNTTDCDVSKSTATCRLRCPNTCPTPPGSFQEYTGYGHSVHTSPGSERPFFDSPVECWTSYTCFTHTNYYHKCDQGSIGFNECDDDEPESNCFECKVGAGTLHYIADATLDECEED